MCNLEMRGIKKLKSVIVFFLVCFCWIRGFVHAAEEMTPIISEMMDSEAFWTPDFHWILGFIVIMFGEVKY